MQQKKNRLYKSEVMRVISFFSYYKCVFVFLSRISQLAQLSWKNIKPQKFNSNNYKKQTEPRKKVSCLHLQSFDNKKKTFFSYFISLRILIYSMLNCTLFCVNTMCFGLFFFFLLLLFILKVKKNLISYSLVYTIFFLFYVPDPIVNYSKNNK